MHSGGGGAFLGSLGIHFPSQYLGHLAHVPARDLPTITRAVYCCPPHHSAGFLALDGQELCLILFVLYGRQFRIRHVVGTEKVLDERVTRGCDWHAGKGQEQPPQRIF